jgi:Concanavalin A-like lectin/glucanases superfamily
MRKLFIVALVILAFLPVHAGRSFNGTSDVITIPGNGNAIDVTGQQLSISAWVYFTTVPTAEAEPLAKADTGATQYEIYVSAGGRTSKEIGVYMRQSTPVNHDVFMDCAVISNATWYNVVASYNSVAGTWAIYLNGVRCNNSTTGLNGVIQSNGDNLLIGGKAASSPIFCTCTVAEVGIWNIGLTAGEALSLGKGVPPSLVHRGNLQGYWPLWGASGASTEPDLSGNKINGTLTGTAVANHCPCEPVGAISTQ